MRVINTTVKDVVSDNDTLLVAKEMINIYMGANYYDLSKPDAPIVDNPDKSRFNWIHNGTEYEYVPSLGYINIIVSNKLTDGEQKALFDKIYRSLHEKFKRLLGTGIDNRVSIYKHHKYGAEQFTLEEAEQPKLMHEYNIYDIDEQNCFRLVNRNDKILDLNYGFIWILDIIYNMNDTNFIYGDMKYDPDKYIKDMTSIIFNISHYETQILKHLRYDKTMIEIEKPKDIDYFDVPFDISEIGAIDFEIYKLIGGVAQGYLPSKSRSSYESKTYHTRFYDFSNGVNVYKWPGGNPKFHIVGEYVSEFLNDASKKIKACKAKEVGEICGMCKVELFDDYYIITKKQNLTKAFRACRFCIHHTNDMIRSINNDYTVFRTRANLTWETILNTKCKDTKVANLLKTIKLALSESGVIYKYELDTFVGIKPTNQQLFLIKDEYLQKSLSFTEKVYDRKIVVSNKYKFIGLKYIDINQVLINIDVFKPGTTIFHYN